MSYSECNDGLSDFDDLELDAGMAWFRESLSLNSKSEIHDFSFGISPTHSSDSGVDNLEDYLFDFENRACFSNEWLEEGHFNNDAIRDATDGLPWMEQHNRDKLMGKLKVRRKTKLEETIDEDHCYTNRVLENHSSDNTTINVLQVGKQSCRGSQALMDMKRLSSHPFEGTKRAASTKKTDENLEEMTLKSTLDRCTNRNAVMARLNRERKKRYVNNLESEVSTLRKMNSSLSEENQNLKVSISKCREELAYLQNVLGNQSMLSSVIKAVSGIAGVNLKGIVKTSGKNNADDKNSTTVDKDIPANGDKSQKWLKEDTINGEQYPTSANSIGNGVCLHVQQENVSIEFCHHCSAHATASK